jgi:hypothetical protein
MPKTSLALIGSAKEYFQQSLQEALIERKVETYPLVQNYLVTMLEYYLLTDNLFNEENGSGKRTHETLAEMMLKASSSSPRVRYELLKKLGDTALYVSGFFGDSLQRKVVDVDYYIDMGSTAYISLSEQVYEDTSSQLYREIARKFNEFVDVFTVMSRKSMHAEKDNILRLMEILGKTGSTLAQDQLIEKGIFTRPDQIKIAKNQ